MWAMIKLIQLRLEYRKTLLHILHKHIWQQLLVFLLAIVGIYVGNHVEASGSHIYLLKNNLVLLPTYYCQVTVVLDCTDLYTLFFTCRWHATRRWHYVQSSAY